MPRGDKDKYTSKQDAEPATEGAEGDAEKHNKAKGQGIGTSATSRCC
jgi:hypothetical protein